MNQLEQLNDDIEECQEKIEQFEEIEEIEDDSDLSCKSISMELQQNPQDKPKKRNRRKIKVKQDIQLLDNNSQDQQDIYDDQNQYDRLPKDKNKLRDMLAEVSGQIKTLRNQFFNEQRGLLTKKSHVGENSIPICADIRTFDFQRLLQTQLKITNRQFDVIMMDPPWKLSSATPSRGVAINYCSLADQIIGEIPVQKLQNNGFLLVWVINAKYQWTVQTMQKKWGYKVVDSISWIKQTVNGKIAKGHGYYLQHAKQTCLVGVKGNIKYKQSVASDIIFSKRRGQSQKPTQIYEYVEQLVPNGHYLQIFGRRNNLRNGWVTIGNQL